MTIVDQSYKILTPIDPKLVYGLIEEVARTCYKSEDKICEGSAERMVKALIKHNHLAMLEHFSITVKFVTDRGVANELVRHRNCSFAQESTRYCNYSSGVCFIKPPFKSEEAEWIWTNAADFADQFYAELMGDRSISPEIARSVLPLCTKTEIVVTTNLREWRHIFKLRVLGTTGRPHPQIKALLSPLLDELGDKLPIVFGDLKEASCGTSGT